MRTVRYLTFFVAIAWVLWRGAFGSQEVVAATNFTKRTPYFDVLLPAGRVARTGQGILLNQEPVYVDVRLPIRAKAIELELEISSNSAPLKLGVLQGPDWSIAFPGERLRQTSRGLAYQVSADEFPYLSSAHRLRFVVSSPDLAPGAIAVLGARARIERAPFSWGWLTKVLR